MKSILPVLFSILAFASAAATRISQLPMATNIAPADMFLVNTGAPSQQLTRTISVSNLLNCLAVLTNNYSAPASFAAGLNVAGTNSASYLAGDGSAISN